MMVFDFDNDGSGVCRWCRMPLDFRHPKETDRAKRDPRMSVGWIHRATGTMYVCKHGKDPLQCCGRDDHCVLPDRRNARE